MNIKGINYNNYDINQALDYNEKLFKDKKKKSKKDKSVKDKKKYNKLETESKSDTTTIIVPDESNDDSSDCVTIC